jgi:ferric-dicitrate binding protein FerR (iron transport regulator)
MNPNDPRLEALQRYADGLATREDVTAVEQGILNDAEFRQLAVEYLHLDSAMEQFAVIEEAPLPVTASPRVVVERSHLLRWALAAAAVVAIMGLVLWTWRPVKTPPATVEVEVLQLTNATMAGTNANLRVHDRTRLAALELRGGEAQLRLSSGVKLAVSGPAELNFIDPMHARVLHGKVTVDCGAHGQGFILDTPVTRVVDVSTQFGVEARADGATDVLVIKGEVKLFDPQQSQPAAPLEQGEAVRVNPTQTMARIVNITGSLQPAEWSTQPPPDQCNIVSVSDNFGASEGYHYYRIVPGGLRPGATIYSNRPYVWRPVGGRDFPAALLNADVVQTFFGELRHPAYAIEITVARPVELFVIMSQRGIAQPWLTENFTRTGDEVMLDEFSSPPHLHFDVWKRIVPQAGKITLGPGNRDANGNPTGMYGIAARALSP